MTDYRVEERTEIQGHVGFRKYAMSKWKDLPMDYLEWLVGDECHSSDANKNKARLEIKNRNLIPGQHTLF